MNVHEFQAKQLFGQFGIPVPRGKEITSPEAGAAWAAELNTPVFVVKAQIHAGGRGKAGSENFTKDKATVPGLVKELIGKTLITHQTGPKGREVRRLLIEEGAAIAKELYVSVSSSIGIAGGLCSSRARKAGWRSKKSQPTRRRRSSGKRLTRPWGSRGTTGETLPSPSGFPPWKRQS